MSTFIASEIESIMNVLVEKYNDKISQVYKVDKEKLKTLWTSTIEQQQQPATTSPFKMVKVSGLHLASLMSCDYVYTKGDKVGEKCKNPCQDGLKYCSVHRYHINKSTAPKIPDTIECPTRVPDDELVPPIKPKYSPFKVRWSPEIKRYVDVKNNFVLKSVEDYNIILGKKIGTNICPLSNEDMKMIVKLSLTYQPLDKKWKQREIEEEVDLSLVDTSELLELQPPLSSDPPQPQPTTSRPPLSSDPPQSTTSQLQTISEKEHGTKRKTVDVVSSSPSKKRNINKEIPIFDKEKEKSFVACLKRKNFLIEEEEEEDTSSLTKKTKKTTEEKEETTKKTTEEKEETTKKTTEEKEEKTKTTEEKEADLQQKKIIIDDEDDEELMSIKFC
jgi:hypothetical protein